MTKPRAVEVFPAARGVVWLFTLKMAGQWAGTALSSALPHLNG